MRRIVVKDNILVRKLNKLFGCIIMLITMHLLQRRQRIYALS